MDLHKRPQRRIRQWMARYADEYSNATQLAEGVAAALDLYEDDQFTIAEDIYELAMEFIDEDNNLR